MPEKNLEFRGRRAGPSAFPLAPPSKVPCIFLVSPANTGAKRGQLLCREGAEVDLAVSFPPVVPPLGHVYSFISRLYFPGKLSYSRAFANPPRTVPGLFVMTTSRGLL